MERAYVVIIGLVRRKEMAALFVMAPVQIVITPMRYAMVMEK
jgi:hypothetical protein